MSVKGIKWWFQKQASEGDKKPSLYSITRRQFMHSSRQRANQPLRKMTNRQQKKGNGDNYESMKGITRFIQTAKCFELRK